MSCPMTKSNCDKYKILDKEVKSFCQKGCSVSCEEEFTTRFILKNKVGQKQNSINKGQANE